MTPTTDGPARRGGYTLVELLMVIAIISILAALLLSAITRVRDAAKKTSVTSDITQLDETLTKFKQDFNVQPASHVLWTNASGQVLPRRFQFPSRMNDPATSSQEPEFAFLKRMFPRWNPSMPNGNDFDLTRMNTYTVGPGGASAAGQPDPLYHPDYVQLVNLTNKTVNPQANGLDPNQMMALQLGGPMALFQNTTYLTSTPALSPNPPGGSPALGLGWDVSGPFAPVASASTKKGPHFDFPTDRLVPATALLNANLLSHFVDPWGTPFAFFSATTSEAYDSRAMFPWTADPQSPTDPLIVGYDPENDPNKAVPATNPKGTFTAHPYRSAAKWLSPGKVQIISAGPNRQFGPGGAIVATSVATGAGFPPGSKMLYPYQVPGAPPVNPPAYWTILWEPSQIGQHPYYQEKTRGEDDYCNFNGGSNLGTSNAP